MQKPIIFRRTDIEWTAEHDPGVLRYQPEILLRLADARVTRGSYQQRRLQAADLSKVAELAAEDRDKHFGDQQGHLLRKRLKDGTDARQDQ